MMAFLKANWKHLLLVSVVALVKSLVAAIPALAPYQSGVDQVLIALGLAGTAALPQVQSGK